MQLYMFQTDLLSIIRCLDTVFRAIGICIQKAIIKFENSELKMCSSDSMKTVLNLGLTEGRRKLRKRTR